MNNFDFSAIIEVRSGALFYLDDNDIQQEIDLEQCRSNWVDYINKSEEFTDILGHKSVLQKKDSHCVGTKNINGEPPFYEFFADEPIRFVLYMKPTFWDCFKTDWKARHYKRFNQLQQTLQEQGYTTYDLS